MNQCARSILLGFFLFLTSLCRAQPDSVIIRGRVLNLTASLYRQAPFLVFTRNNILQPQSELTRQAPLQPDGSFRVAMPLIYPQEEIYLDYGGKVFTTFLAAPGELQVSFDADSMATAKRLFHFAGVNAEANNQYIDYVVEEGRLLKENKRYGESFFSTFWELDPSEARKAASRRADLRMSALLPLSQRGHVSPALRNWVNALVKEEELSNLYEYTLANDLEVPNDTKDSLSRLTTGLMTFQRVQWATRVGDYADRLIARRAYQNPTRSKALSVDRMAKLIKKYVQPLSSSELDRLNTIIREGTTTASGLDFLNSLYGRNRQVMELVTTAEKRDNAFNQEFDGATADLLDARLLAQQFYQLSLAEQSVLYGYIKEKIKEPTVRASLDELYQLETKDSASIAFVETIPLSDSPREVLNGIWLSQTNGNGKDWYNKIQKLYKGKTLYIIKWNLFDDGSRNEVLYAPALRAQLPADVEFIYIHVPSQEVNDSPALWKKFIARHKLRGVHLFLNEKQAVQLLFKLNPLTFPSYGIIKPNGKYESRTAPSPSNGQIAAEALLRARSGR